MSYYCSFNIFYSKIVIEIVWIPPNYRYWMMELYHLKMQCIGLITESISGYVQAKNSSQCDVSYYGKGLFIKSRLNHAHLNLLFLLRCQ